MGKIEAYKSQLDTIRMSIRNCWTLLIFFLAVVFGVLERSEQQTTQGFVFIIASIIAIIVLIVYIELFYRDIKIITKRLEEWT